MTDYKYDELLEGLKDQRNLCINYKNECETQMNKYKSIFETDDKFEVKYHEYWKATIIELNKQIQFLNSIIQKQEEYMLEEIAQFEEAEEYVNDLKYEAGFGI